jgi:signal transduction histidine kinase
LGAEKSVRFSEIKIFFKIAVLEAPMCSDNSINPGIETSDPVNFSVGAVKGLLVAGFTLVLAVAVVLFFSVLQSTFASFLVWIDLHPDLPVWIQAIGVPGSLWVALFIYHRKEVHRREGDQKRAKRVITQLKRALAGLRVKLNEMETTPLKKKKIQIPKMMQQSRDFHLLEDVRDDLELLVDDLINLNRLQAEAEIKEAKTSCHQLLDAILEGLKKIEASWSNKKLFVVRRVLDATQRLFWSQLLRMNDEIRNTQPGDARPPTNAASGCPGNDRPLSDDPISDCNPTQSSTPLPGTRSPVG